jgi:hypothetical protein
MRRERLIRLYGLSGRWRERAVEGLSAAFDGFWLGMFDRETLAAVDEAFYHVRTESLGGSEVTYADERWNTSGLSAWERAAVEAHFPPGGRVAVTGAGGGREVLALLELGYDATGFEPHGGLAEAGRALLERRGHPDRLHVAERDRFPPGAGPYDAVLVGWGSYTLIPGRARRIAFLRQVRAALPDDAPVLLSFFTRAEAGRAVDVIFPVARVVRRLRRAEPPERGDLLTPNFGHAFERAEIESELRASGFELVDFAEQPYGHAVGRATASA